ncbi:TraR/DksA C4-type zinc finger protein [Streptomyces sp. NPDC006458]|uniref:TraR/DksA family transcriptional regulator n=1 Tax=Streptomyces sp. NPDC006458 TaxID=3154302 RepID=UPI0033B082B5
MVAKKTAAEQPASGGSTGSAAKDIRGKKRAQGAASGKSADGKSADGKAVVKKAPARKTANRKAPAGKTAAEASPSSEAAGRTSGRTAARAAAAEKTDGHVPPAAGGPAAKAAAKKATAGRTAAAKSAGAGRKITAKKAHAARAAEQTGATTVGAKKTPGTATAAQTAVPKARGTAVEPGELAVRPGEDPWTPEEVAEARTELTGDMQRLKAELASSEESLVGLMRDSGDGAGDDEADTGTKNITREHELALAANAREMLIQSERALERLDAGTYGLCENCGKAIGKARMQAFPRATLCVECKQKQERRY